MTQYTDGTYLANNPTWHTQDSGWKLSHVLRALQEAGVNNFQSVCDMGCGSGELIKQWALQNPPVKFTGYDISPQAYTLCVQNNPKEVTFVTGEQVPKGPFDIALIIDVLEHIEQEEQWLCQVLPSAKYGVLHIPLQRCLNSFLRPQFLEDERRLVGHVHFYTPKDVEQMLKRNGLKICSWHYTNIYLERPPELKTWKSRLGMKIRRFLHAILPLRLAALTVGGYSVMCVVSLDKANVEA